MTQAVLIDCDPGYDDAAALILAAGSPALELVGVTTVAGNQTLEKVTGNARRILKLLGSRAPVAAGARSPLLSDAPRVCPEIHGESGLDGVELPEEGVPLDPRPAARFIAETILEREPGSVTLIPTGPLTNIAAAVLSEPRIVSRVREVVLMGGAVHAGNVGPFSEFNIANDPEAADIVFRAGWPVVMVGLDLTRQARADEAVRRRARSIPTRAGRLLAEVLEAFTGTYRRARGYDAPPLHDPCAVARVIAPETVRARPVPIAVECAGRWTRGMTVCDFRREPPADMRTQAALELDAPAFWDLLMDAAARLP